MRFDDAPRQLDDGRADAEPLGDGAELQRQAFGDRTGTDAEWLEALHQPQRRRQLVRVDAEFGGQRSGDLVEGGVQIAVVLDLLDQQPNQRAVPLRAACTGQLQHQMVAQRPADRPGLLRAPVIVAVVAAAAAGLAAPGLD